MKSLKIKIFTSFVSRWSCPLDSNDMQGPEFDCGLVLYLFLLDYVISTIMELDRVHSV